MLALESVVLSTQQHLLINNGKEIPKGHICLFRRDN